ncbi:ABC transporter permease [Snuella sedimenti]|uniref:ABC transporter permease n=1 Tax=Snuella sedimenti TaxID=2798802 RepID=A0A8J7JCP1_9FLAO|nr:ABC transporter permease [Snuella sedimenti]MBJ6368554.1 ABC transporter permease [Snuella sedimenti]
MIKYYVRIAIRNLIKHKVILVSSMLTLCLGTLCTSLLLSYIYNELTTDGFHKNKKQIYFEVFRSDPDGVWTNPPPAIDIDYNSYPEVEAVTSVAKLDKKYKSATVYHNNESYYTDGIVADTTFFKVFDFDLKYGDKKSILYNPYHVVLSEAFAKVLFGNKNPIGEKLKITTGSEIFYTVKGVIKIPSNSSITFDLLFPKPTENSVIKHGQLGMKFILINDSFKKSEFIEKVKQLKIISPYIKEYGLQVNYLPFDALYYNNMPIRADVLSRRGDTKTLKIVFAIILVIIVISALNFSNAQIININNSIKYNALLTINGAKKSHILYQKLVEYAILYTIGLLFVTICYRLVLPEFNALMKIELQPSNLVVFTIIGCTLIFMMFLALIYPLLVIYKRTVVTNIKSIVNVNGNLTTRKAILVIQYVLAITLLITSILVSKQLHLMLNKDLGFDCKDIVRIKFYNKPTFNYKNDEEQYNLKKQLPELIKNKLAEIPLVVGFSQGKSPIMPIPLPLRSKNSNKEFHEINFLSVGANYKSVFGLTLIEGQWFNNNATNNIFSKNEIIVNEAAKTFWKIKDINADIILTPNENFKGYKIIGVVKNFNSEHLSSKPKPLVLFPSVDWNADCFIKLQTNRINDGLQTLEALFKKANPEGSFKYTFLSDEIIALYKKEKDLRSIFVIFTGIALLISAIGLFTIALYDTQRRTKEIGIRKVNGATINEIMLMLNKDFVKWVGIAFIIACPIAYYAMNKWLENFAYKTVLSWWVFALAGVFTLVIALLTVSWQTYRAATRDPVESLRDE